MTLLLLGGTGEAKTMARRLHMQGLPLIYSVAGLVRQPQLQCEVISGGFRQRGGLLRFIQQRAVTAVLDMTHPYAVSMSEQAAQVCTRLQLPYWRYQRPVWEQQPGDQWQRVSQCADLLQAVADKRSLFWSIGQTVQTVFAQLDTRQRHVLRSAQAPANEQTGLSHVTWLQAVGPFSVEDELKLFRQYQIDCLISKESGGAATRAKLDAARQLDIPVLLLARPVLPTADMEWKDVSECEQFVTNTFAQSSLIKVKNDD